MLLPFGRGEQFHIHRMNRTGGNLLSQSTVYQLLSLNGAFTRKYFAHHNNIEMVSLNLHLDFAPRKRSIKDCFHV